MGHLTMALREQSEEQRCRSLVYRTVSVNEWRAGVQTPVNATDLRASRRILGRMTVRHVVSVPAFLSNRINPEFERLVVSFDRSKEVRPKFFVVSRLEHVQIEIAPSRQMFHIFEIQFKIS